MSFKKIDATLLVADEQLALYLGQCKIGSANRGGTFAGNREVAPQTLRQYGIILPKGGMILPDIQPAELKQILQEVELLQKNREKEAKEVMIRQWAYRVEAEVLPVIREILLEETGSVCGLQIKEGSGVVCVDGLDGFLLQWPDESPAGILNVLATKMDSIRLMANNKAFLLGQQERINEFKKTVSSHAHFGVKWESSEWWLIHEVPGVKIPGNPKNFPVFVRGNASYEQIALLRASESTTEQLMEELAPLRSAEADRKKNEARLREAYSLFLAGGEVLLQDSYVEVTYNTYRSQFEIAFGDLYCEFNRKSFYWNDKGVNELIREIKLVRQESDKFKTQIDAFVNGGGQPETVRLQNTIEVSSFTRRCESVYTEYLKIGDNILVGRALTYYQRISKKK